MTLCDQNRNRDGSDTCSARLAQAARIPLLALRAWMKRSAHAADKGTRHEIWSLVSGDVTGDDAAAAERGGNLRGRIEHGFAGVGMPRGRPDDDEIGETAWCEHAAATFEGQSPRAMLRGHRESFTRTDHAALDKRTALGQYRQIGVRRTAVGADRHADAGCGQDRNGWKPP